MGILASKVSELAKSGFLKGEPYSRYDCQGYIKALIREFGIYKRWAGTNDMWRNFVHNKHLIRDAPEIPAGAMLFTVDYNSKPPERYNSGPNCKHVGIYCGNGEYWHSTTGGVQKGERMNRWTHWAMLDCLEYATDKNNTVLEVGNVIANSVKIHYKEADGTEDYEVLELGDEYNVTGVEVYLNTNG